MLQEIEILLHRPPPIPFRTYLGVLPVETNHSAAIIPAILRDTCETPGGAFRLPSGSHVSPCSARGRSTGFQHRQYISGNSRRFSLGPTAFLGEMMAESPVRLQLRTERRDEVFARPDQPIGDFTFNAKVADVFDDMVSRSVPYYEEMQRMVCELAQDFAAPA